MIEIPISELKLSDVRSRAIVSIEGQPVAGVIERCSVWGRLDCGPEKDWYSIVLKVGVAQVDTGHLPGDFLIQVERGVND